MKGENKPPGQTKLTVAVEQGHRRLINRKSKSLPTTIYRWSDRLPGPILTSLITRYRLPGVVAGLIAFIALCAGMSLGAVQFSFGRSAYLMLFSLLFSCADDVGCLARIAWRIRCMNKVATPRLKYRRRLSRLATTDPGEGH